MVLARSRPHFPTALHGYEAYMQAGAFFPDAYYSCVGNSEAAEEAHWPPFLAAAVGYWKEKYGNGIQDRGGRGGGLVEGLGLKAFLYGAFTHQVADVGWHSLGVKQGLLSMLAVNEFNGDVDIAHG